MKVVIDKKIDITKYLESPDKSSEPQSDFFGSVMSQKVYSLNDTAGKFNPSNPFSVFSSYNWLGASIVETDNQGSVVWAGEIADIRHSIKGGVGRTLIYGREALALVLDELVESLDKATYSGFTVASNTAADSTTIDLTGGSGSIPEFAIISFNDSIAPRYAVMSATGSPTGQITIDRGLETSLSAGDTLTVGIPKTTTAAQEIKDSLIAVGLSDILDESFDSFISQEAGRNIVVNVRSDDGKETKLKDHLKFLLEIGNFGLYQLNGKYGIFRKYGFSGKRPTVTLTEKEIVGDITDFYHWQDSVAGYDLLYKNGDTVSVVSSAVDEETRQAARAVKRWRPFANRDLAAWNHLYLYADEPTAIFYGDRVEDYLKHKRRRLTFSCKWSSHGKTQQPLNLFRGQEILLNIKTDSVSVKGEPAQIISLQADARQYIYQSITVELSNTPTPDKEF